MERQPEDTFFHRRHVVNLTWVLVAAALSAAVTVPTTLVITQRLDRNAPPQRVFVVNVDTALRTAQSDPRRPPASKHDSIRLSPEAWDQLERTLKAESLFHDSARKELRKLDPQQDIVQPIAMNRRATTNTPEIGIAKGGKTIAFSLPKTVRGDVTRDVSQILASGCPAILEEPGATVYLSTSLRAEANAANYTPLFVRLLSPQPGNAVVQLVEQTVPLSQANVVPVTLPKVPGHYHLEFGVYERSDLGKEYPTFFRRVCNIEVR